MDPAPDHCDRIWAAMASEMRYRLLRLVKASLRTPSQPEVLVSSVSLWWAALMALISDATYSCCGGSWRRRAMVSRAFSLRPFMMRYRGDSDWKKVRIKMTPANMM